MTTSYQHLSAERSDDFLVLKVEIEKLNEYETAEAFGKEMISALEEHGNPPVIVDLSQLEYMASVGYGPFVGLRIHVQKHDGRLILCCLSKLITEIFTATRLLISPSSKGSRFEHAETREDAIAMLQAGT